MKDVQVVTLKDVMEALQLLIEKYKFNIDVLSKLLDVKKEVSDLVENPKLVPLESKYKISKTVMSLRFFFKELEP